MINWLTGNSGAGKTTLALKLQKMSDKTIILDGDDMRDAMGNKDLSRAGRWENNLQVARLAVIFEKQGFDVIVAVICPYEELRQQVREITNCYFTYLPYKGDDQIPEMPYERPTLPDETLPEREKPAGPKARVAA